MIVTIQAPDGEKKELTDMEFESIDRQTASGNLVALTIDYGFGRPETIIGAEIVSIQSEEGEGSSGSIEI